MTIKIRVEKNEEFINDEFEDYNKAIQFLNDLWSKDMEREDVKK